MLIYIVNVRRCVSVSTEDVEYFLKDYKVGSVIMNKAYTSTTK